jgi:cytochrome c biogenesis protein CcmG/thiol:disulfide interchange protein DsbE
MKKILTILFLLCSVFCFSQTDSTATLPDVDLKDMDGNDINIAKYGTNGKITIISFWATWCKPCIKELKNVN